MLKEFLSFRDTYERYSTYERYRASLVVPGGSAAKNPPAIAFSNYGQRFRTLYRRQRSRPSPRKRNAKRQKSCLMRLYKQLRKEEELKAKEKRKDIPI